MFILYYATNTCSLAAHIALEDAGADYELGLEILPGQKNNRPRTSK